MMQGIINWGRVADLFKPKGSQLVDYLFTTDGCSGGMTALWRLISRRDPPWQRACVEHDSAYWKGGSKRDRALADGLLSLRVMNQGHSIFGFLMWCAVRLGGHPLLPLPWRWGYGWKWPRGYSSENQKDIQL